MSTRTRTGNRPATTVVFKSKSDHARALFAEGKTVVEVTKATGIGYAFAYGIAKRAGVAETAANRKPTKRVVTNPDGSVSVTTTAGVITVQPDGTVIRPTVKKARTAKVAKVVAE